MRVIFAGYVLADGDVEVDIAGDRTPGVATEVLFATWGLDALLLRAALTSVRALHSRASSACSREAPAISFITTEDAERVIKAYGMEVVGPHPRHP